MNTVMQHDWMGYRSNVCKPELQQWENDWTVSAVTDGIVNLPGDEADSSLSESGRSTNEDKSEYDDSNDSDLAQLLPNELSGHRVA
jgi:hypothetical protein